MKLSSNFQINTKAIIVMAIYGIVLSTVYTTSISNVYAAPKNPNWDNSKCNRVLDGVECCWREKVPGQILGKEVCQTCDGDGKNCGDVETQVEELEKNDCSTRPQLSCPQGDIPQFEQESPFVNPSNVKDLEELPQSNTDLSSIVGDENTKQSINEDSNSDFTELSSHDDNSDDSQNQSSQD
ncbi:MAG TPA: hypothetical protein VJR94_02780 [Candidatus Nitrosocosmicus sp.]|nr:hypothetical protein [Candidatus Nitrosocosmicus sp.]